MLCYSLGYCLDVRSSPLLRPIMIGRLLVLALVALPVPVGAQEASPYDGPIIDMHLHAYTTDTYWGPAPHPVTGRMAPASAEAHRQATLEAMDQHDIVLGAVSGDVLEAAEVLAERTPNRFLVGIEVEDPEEDLDVESFLDWVRDGRLEIFAEVGAQYGGFSPSDPAFEAYWSLAEEHGIPAGIHTGESFPGTPYDECCPDFRVRLGDPLLLEDMLVAHPDLKVMVMHAGGFYWRRTFQLMQMYPQVYAELGVLAHAPGLVKAGVLEAFVREAKKLGMLDRVMFGSDQMIWPEAIGITVEAVQKLDFLTLEEKAAIFYDNAARFLGLDEETITRQHGR